MKTHLIVLIHILILMHLALDFNTINIKHDSDAEVSGKIITNDSLVFEGQANDYFIYKNTTTNLFLIKDKKENIKLEELKYFGQINTVFQVLNKETEIEYYDYNLKKSSTPPKQQMNFMCGNVSTYLTTIEKKNNYYLIKSGEGFTNRVNPEDLKTMDSIPARYILDICFINGDRILEHDGNIRSPEHIIIQYENDFGIYLDKKIELYDQIYDDHWPLKIRCDNLYGYYKTTNGTPYTSLGKYNINLAAIETVEGHTGYIDGMGEEYLKEL